jgi:hypothetical protein
MSQVHANVPLTNISIAYIQSAADFVADKVFPVVPVDKQADSYYRYKKNDWFRDEAQERAPGTESAGGGYNIDHDAVYNCRTWGYHKDVPWDVRNNQDPAINMDNDATLFVTQRLLVRRERLFADSYFKASVWGKDYTGVASSPGANQFIQWSDYANSNPIDDVKNGRMSIKGITGFKPNTLLLGEEVFEILKQHPDILDRYKYTQAGVITADLIARVFEVDRLIVAGAVYATNAEGGTEAYSFIHGKGALLCYSAPNPGLLVPSAGYTFAWRNLANNVQSGMGVAISKFEMRHLKADRVEGEIAIDPKLVAADMGAFYASAVA